ncbi:SMI1/KNR4 family protein [Nodularia spumigena]|uniref:SMI1/KNR4 family protein n=1 Tax=Nodularia spumigena TaxID=70799 RepID=UPI00232C602B|nr:SMI1/KNR4 family protein [Nodularia spumigena]MDB9317606.1 SMI1/KNR4 family protein [Nodularia spumigena CS-590/01A]MDB9328486.1 SMI1/KNR4 family protein [Nodularia spumigena CS-590/02]MDB9337211.1 SMI1/KNR4 family protein [Nodularia spumigena CS-590/01]
MKLEDNQPIQWQSYLWEQSRPATLSDIERIETALRIHFPNDYRDVVMQHQGEIPQQNLFDFIENNDQTILVMGVLFHFLEDKSESGFYTYNILENYKNRRHLLPPQVIPFSEDPGGNCIAFDFRKTPDAPTIVFVDHEAVGEANWISYIAANFTEFLSLLYEDTDLTGAGVDCS